MASQLSLHKYFGGKDIANKSKGSTENKIKYEAKRKRGFIASWQSEFTGLIDTENGMVCTVCQKFKTMADATTFLTGNSSYRIDNIQSHFSSPKHLQCEGAFQAEQRKAANEY